jgi:altronate dehydratase large subunit
VIEQMRSRALLMHAGDSVALAAVDLPAGSAVQVGGAKLVVRQDIPFGHKLAVQPITEGQAVFKYGQPIGRATQAIAAGEHVHVHNVESVRGRGDLSEDQESNLGTVAERPGPARPSLTDDLSSADLPRMSSPPQFLGYRRPDGRVGVRNHVLVLSTVDCASAVVDRIGRELPEVVALTHPWGCSQVGADLAQTQRVLTEFAGHPNVAACLLIGLGCETMPGAEIAGQLAERGVLIQRLTIQAEGGNRPTLARGLGIAREFLQEAANARREPVAFGELIVGVECGGSDGWSGVTANPAVGAASDMVVAAGGTVILSEVPEFIGAEHLLAARATEPEIAASIYAACRRYEVEARRMGVDLRGAQPTPGNIAGGLTTIEEKSLGAIAKGGSAAVREFLPYGCRPTRRGLVVMDTPGNDPESVTGMVAGGAQVVVFTTGRGSPTGCPIAPVIKVASNTPMFRRLQDDLDLDAGTILDGDESVPDVGRRILAAILTAVDGQKTAAEEWGHKEFAINMIGPRL